MLVPARTQAHVAAACPAVCTAHSRGSRRPAAQLRVRATRASCGLFVAHAQDFVPSRRQLSERVGSTGRYNARGHCIRRGRHRGCMRACLGRPGGGHRSHRGQPRRRRRVCRTAVDVRARSEHAIVRRNVTDGRCEQTCEWTQLTHSDSVDVSGIFNKCILSASSVCCRLHRVAITARVQRLQSSGVVAE